MQKPKALLLFSGGFDSVVLLNDLIDSGFEVTTLFINYEQKGFYDELSAVGYWVGKFKLDYKVLSIPSISWSQSTVGNAGVDTGNIWKDEYVEMRNLIFLAYASSYAQAKGIPEIYTGFIHGEHYSDTDPKFVKAIDSLLYSCAGIEVIAPYNRMTKYEVAEFAADTLKLNMREVFNNSITCNTPESGKECGKCHGCNDVKNLRELFIK